jgi:hypothetical protein
MALFRLYTTGASLQTGGGLEGIAETAGWFLSLSAKFERRTELVVTTGEKTEEFEIHVTLRQCSDDYAQWLRSRGKEFEKAVGHLRYSEAWSGDFYGSPPMLSFEVILGGAQMDLLRSFAKHGRFPREISAEVGGVEYDWQPDGRGKKWDTAAQPVVPLNSISFSLPISEPDTDEFDSDAPPKLKKPETTVVAPALLAELRAILQWQRGTFYVVAAVGAYLLYRATK